MRDKFHKCRCDEAMEIKSDVAPVPFKLDPWPSVQRIQADMTRHLEIGRFLGLDREVRRIQKIFLVSGRA